MISPAAASQEVGHSSKITTTLRKHSVYMLTLLNVHHMLMGCTVAAQKTLTMQHLVNSRPHSVLIHNKEVNEVNTVHSTSIQYIIQLLLICCWLGDHVSDVQSFIFTLNLISIHLLQGCPR